MMPSEPLSLDTLASEPDLLHCLSDIRPRLLDIYSTYFTAGCGLQPETAASKSRSALTGGLSIHLKQGGIDFAVKLKPTMAILDVYMGALATQQRKKLNNLNDALHVIENATERHHEIANMFSTLYLINLRNKLEREITIAVQTAADLSKVEIAKPILSSADWRVRIDKINNDAAKLRNAAEGRVHGGSRPREGFKWDQEKKNGFYQAVSKSPVFKEKPIWEYACRELIEQECDDETVEWLLGRPAYRNVNKTLFREAVDRWRKYYEYSEIKADKDKPRHFQFRQALYDLGFPQDFAFSTLQNHFYSGKKNSGQLR